MIIETLKLTQFRNYDAATLIFHPQVNALTGMNGMGKTNVLDALYYLCLGKSYFSGTDKMVMMQNKDFFRVEGHFYKQNDKEIVVVKSKFGHRKEIEISGKKVEKISDHVGRFLCVIIAPDDIQMMLEGSEERRNFLNNTIVQTDKFYLDDLLLYNGLLKRRNTLLKTFADQKRFDALLLESVTTGMFGPALRIYNQRKAAIEQMIAIFRDTYEEISGNKEQCNILYQSQLANDSLEYLMQKNMDKDRILARTTQGIHKDDLIFTMNGEPLRNFASQGQLKSFVLALKLTQYRLLKQNSGQQPILLLDDIFDKLDHLRVRQMLTMLIKNGFGQIFITDTNQDRISEILEEIGTEYKVFSVVDGTVSVYSLDNQN
ncbi:MAG: DNA replication and repair protein RecF [Saprospiraceae bacterium]|nr:DNA replication and repair protein RecF [Saprospiraceae bacterium]